MNIPIHSARSILTAMSWRRREGSFGWRKSIPSTVCNALLIALNQRKMHSIERVHNFWAEPVARKLTEMNRRERKREREDNNDIFNLNSFPSTGQARIDGISQSTGVLNETKVRWRLLEFDFSLSFEGDSD